MSTSETSKKTQGETVEGEVVDQKELLKARKKRKLTPKQKKFLTEYLDNGGNATQAAIVACDVTTRGGAEQSGKHFKDKLQPEIQNALTKYGLSDERVMTVHNELLDSRKDNVRMDAVKTYYKLKHDGTDSKSDTVINLNLNF